MAVVVERATARAVCLAFARALARYGVPEEVITDNGKQFTDRFSRYAGNRGEVLFDKICRKNGIRYRLTAPASPNQNGKVERFHGMFPRATAAGPFTSIEAAQARVDVIVEAYNRDRPHQGLDEQVPVVPADRFTPASSTEIELRLPPALEITATVQAPDVAASPAVGPLPTIEASLALELERTVPASGNLAIRGQQFWLGQARAGQVITFWLDCDWVHLSTGGARIKTLRSRFSAADLAWLLLHGGAVTAGPAPVSSRPGPGSRAGRTVVEVERTVARSGTISLGSHVVLAAEILAAAGSGSTSKTVRRCCSSTPPPASCCAPGPTHSPPVRPSGCNAPARPGHRRGPRANPSPCNAEPPTPASSWSPDRRSPSAASTPEPP